MGSKILEIIELDKKYESGFTLKIDCGFKINSFVTRNSVERLELFTGKKIIAGIKASSIHLFKK